MADALESGVLFMHCPVRPRCSDCGVQYTIDSSVMEPPGREQLKLKRLCEERRRRWEGKRGVIFTQIKDTPFEDSAVLLSAPVQMSPYVPVGHSEHLEMFPPCVFTTNVLLKTITFTTGFQHNYQAVRLNISFSLKFIDGVN